MVDLLDMKSEPLLTAREMCSSSCAALRGPSTRR